MMARWERYDDRVEINALSMAFLIRHDVDLELHNI
jgi:hypothetical protein